MGVWMVGATESAAVRVEPLVFHGRCEVRGNVPYGCPEIEERFVCARFRCQKGAPDRTGNDCLVCEHYRGWRDGPGASHVTVACGWSSDAPVWQRMTRAPLVTVPPELPISDAVARALEASVHHLVVVENERLVGVTCLCDLGGGRGDQLVATCLSPRVFAIALSATLGEAAAAMAKLGIGCLPVLDGEQLVGVITHDNLVRIAAPRAADPYLDARDYGEGD
jgi:CBS domain-containing protein